MRIRLVVLGTLLLTVAITLIVTLANMYPSAKGARKGPSAVEGPAKLGDTIDVSLADLLGKSRPELAATADELAAKIQVQEDARRSGSLKFSLLPELHLPLVVPVLREARFSAKDGFSLPPYATEGGKDADLAIHLARFGDAEAALKLADPADAATRARIEALRYERNYPVEWTRVAGLLLHAAQLRVAVGEIDGGTEVLVLHKQLRSVLDAKAARGSLGGALLPQGRKTFTLAVAAWKAAKRPDLVEQAEAVLADWGPVPPPAIPVTPGASRADVARLLRAEAQGRAAVASSPTRALDLFGLPAPAKGAEAAVALFDSGDRLTELLVTYRPRMVEMFPEPVHFAHHLEDHSLSAEDRTPVAGLRRRTYRLANGDSPEKMACEFALVSWSTALGAFVRLGADKPAGTSELARDFGPVHLDRSFEQNRLGLAPGQKNETVTTARPAVLAQLRNPLKQLKATSAELQRDGTTELTGRLTLNYSNEVNESRPLHELAAPLWAVHGAARIEGVESDQTTALGLVWEDARTRYVLRVNNGGELAQLDVLDRRDADEQGRRQTDVQAFDKTERAARFQAGKPISRLPRYLELDQVQLGMGKDQAVQNLPVGQAILKRQLPDGVALTFAGDAARESIHVPRQFLVRFDKQRVVELRVLYVNGPASQNANWGRDLLAGLKKHCGAPAELSLTSAVWADLPAQKPAPVSHRWQDDVTQITCTVTATSAEVTLRDCSLEHVEGVPLAILQTLPRGPEGCKLGDTAADVAKRWTSAKLDSPGEHALVLTPAKPQPYEVLIVWFENDRAVRIVARHVPSKSLQSGSPTQWAQAIQEAWYRDIRAIGWPQRRDAVADAVQGLGWHDDLTRVRIFWQETNDKGPRVFTEWKEMRKP